MGEDHIVNVLSVHQVVHCHQAGLNGGKVGDGHLAKRVVLVAKGLPAQHSKAQQEEEKEPQRARGLGDGLEDGLHHVPGCRPAQQLED